MQKSRTHTYIGRMVVSLGIFSWSTLEPEEGVFHFEKYIQSMIKKENWSEKEAIDFASKLTKKCPDIVIVTQEIGYGLVPVHAFDRRYRELTGRICTVLAANSDQVDRVVCGIGVTIKGGNIK